MSRPIKENKAQCMLCKDILVSKTRHDFWTCKCGNLSVDGGREYIKRCLEKPGSFSELTTYLAPIGAGASS